MPAPTLLFDVYGTLVDPARMAEHVQSDVGDRASAFATAWREKQVEYAFRRGLMQLYEPFSVCTSEAFDHTALTFHHVFTAERRRDLLDRYKTLPAFAEVETALRALGEAGHRLFAFSNGTAADVTAVLQNAAILSLMEGVVSVDDLRTFKPAPAVYAHARRAIGAWAEPCWLISSNAWDVIGARAAGLDAAWVKRSAGQVYDPWGIEPILCVASLSELTDRMIPAPLHHPIR